MPNEIRLHFNFDTGVERIIDAGDTAQLPQSRELLPADIKYEQQLPDLLYQPNWDQELLGALKPPLQHSGLLAPSRFQTVLNDTKSMLDDAVPAADSDQSRQALQSASRLLEEQQSLWDLFNTYRHLLHKA